MARYLHCADCGLTRLAAPASIPGTCPSCRSRGRTVYLTELGQLPPRSQDPGLSGARYVETAIQEQGTKGT
jgi:hypothetical protein